MIQCGISVKDWIGTDWKETGNSFLFYREDRDMKSTKPIKGTAEFTEFTLEERVINIPDPETGKIKSETVMIKVYKSKYDNNNNRHPNYVKPKTKNGGKC